MTQPLISKPLLSMLLLTAVASIVLSQRPDTQSSGADAELLANRAPAGNVAAMSAPREKTQPLWLRKAVPILTAVRNTHPLPPAPPPPPPMMVMTTPPPPPKPTAPAPDFTYLGRMMDAGTITVFLASGENFKAVTVGGKINADWELEGIGKKALKLRYLPLNENKELSLGN